MMSKTHLAIGVGASLTVFRPQTPLGCCLAVIGGAIGGILPDVDIQDSDTTGDALLGQLFALAISAVVLAIDWLFKIGIWKYILNSNRLLLFMGIPLFVALYLIGIMQPHRGSTHSLLALVIYSAPVYLICPMLSPFFAVGFASHLVIDLLNKKKERLFFPLKGGLCLGLCYANRNGNKLLMYIGFGLSIIMLANGLLLHLIH